MKNIRKGVFETNSSSTHSIHIDEETELFDTSLLSNSEGVVTLYGDEYGWEWNKYNSAKDKANYGAIQSSGMVKELLIQAIKEQTGAKEVDFHFHDDWDSDSPGYRAYIDHQSIGTLNGFNTVEKVKNFIFNPNCWIFTGNDNSEAEPNFYDVPLFTEDGEVSIKYDYELSFKGYGQIAKFVDRGSFEKNIIKAIYALMDQNTYIKGEGITSAYDYNNSETYSLTDYDNQRMLTEYFPDKFATVKFSDSERDSYAGSIMLVKKADGTLSKKVVLVKRRKLRNDIEDIPEVKKAYFEYQDAGSGSKDREKSQELYKVYSGLSKIARMNFVKNNYKKYFLEATYSLKKVK